MNIKTFNKLIQLSHIFINWIVRILIITLVSLFVFIPSIYMSSINIPLTVIYLLITYILYLLLFKWLPKDEGVFIQPFVVGCCDEKLNGNAISDLLIVELVRIRRIHEDANDIKPDQIGFFKIGAILKDLLDDACNNEYSILKTRSAFRGIKVAAKQEICSIFPIPFLLSQEEIEFRKSSKREYIFPEFRHNSENLAFNINSTNINGGPITISVNMILMILKKIGGHPVTTITGSLQKYDTTISLVAWMGSPEIGAWEVKRVTSSNKQPIQNSSIIPEMVRDLAFMIARDISKNENTKETCAKTWQGLKYFTEALNAYNEYNVYKDKDKIKLAQEYCEKANEIERAYKEPMDLLLEIGYQFMGIAHRYGDINYRHINDAKKYKNYYYRYDTIHEDDLEGYQNAEKLFQKSIKFYESISNSPDADMLVALGTALAKQHKYNEALDTYHKSYTTKLNIYALNNEGLLFNELGDRSDSKYLYDYAIKNFNKAIKLNPYVPEVYNARGWALNGLGDFKSGLKDFKKALDLDPKFAEALNNKGWALNMTGKYQNALKCFEEAIKLDQNNVWPWYNKGISLLKLKNYEEALKNFDKATQIDPEFIYGKFIKEYRASALNQLGKNEDASKAIVEAKMLADKSRI